MKEYNLEQFLNQTIIWYEDDGFRVSFTEDINNPDYQEYLASLEATEPKDK
jgi:hypothetical protein